MLRPEKAHAQLIMNSIVKVIANEGEFMFVPSTDEDGQDIQCLQFSKPNNMDCYEIYKHLKKPKAVMYLSGAITDQENLGKDLFSKYENIYTEKGYYVVNPHNITDGIDTANFTWEDFMKADIRVLLNCDYVCALPNWSTSKGARVELFISQMLRKKIVNASDFSDFGYHFELKPVPLDLVLQG